MNARKCGNVKTEIYGKARLYNHMIDTAIKSRYVAPKIVYRSRKPLSKTTRLEVKQ